MSTGTRPWRIMCVAMLALALSACSAIRLGYNSLDDLAYWWLNGYFDFTSEQSPRVREDLDRLHAWHRTQELPLATDMLARMEQMAHGSITPAQACGFVAEVRARLVEVSRQAEPAAAALATSLDAQQLAHLQRKYDKNNRKFRKEWIHASVDERRVRREKLYLDRLEQLYGSLAEPQKAVLRQEIARSAFDAQRSLAERQRRQQDLLETLRRMQGAGTDAARQLLHGYVQRVVHSPDAAYRAYQQQLIEEGCRTVAAVHEQTTPRQREHAVQRLRGWQRDMRDLAAQP